MAYVPAENPVIFFEACEDIGLVGDPEVEYYAMGVRAADGEDYFRFVLPAALVQGVTLPSCAFHLDLNALGKVVCFSDSKVDKGNDDNLAGMFGAMTVVAKTTIEQLITQAVSNLDKDEVELLPAFLAQLEQGCALVRKVIAESSDRNRTV